MIPSCVHITLNLHTESYTPIINILLLNLYLVWGNMDATKMAWIWCEHETTIKLKKEWLKYFSSSLLIKRLLDSICASSIAVYQAQRLSKKQLIHCNSSPWRTMSKITTALLLTLLFCFCNCLGVDQLTSLLSCPETPPQVCTYFRAWASFFAPP